MTAKVFRLSFWTVFAMVAVWLGPAIIVPSAAQAQSPTPAWNIPSDTPYLEILSEPVNVMTAGGVAYKLSVDAEKGLVTPHKEWGELRIRLERTRRSPETTSTQSYTYDFFLPPESVHYRGDLSRIRVDTGSILGPLGHVVLRFRSSTAPDESCGGLNATITGIEAGTVTFSPPNDNGFFGTITRTRFRHVTVNEVKGCYPDPPCPPPNFTTNTNRRNAEFRAINLGDSVPAHQIVDVFHLIPGLTVHAFYDQMIDAAVPASTVILIGDSTVQWTTLRRTFLRGATTFTWDRRPPITLPIPCREGASQINYEGMMNGRIVAQFDTGRRRSPDGIPDGAALTKIT